MSRFDYVKYDEEAMDDSAAFKAAFESLEGLVESRLQDGRSKSLALTHLEESYMWIGKSIRDDQLNRSS